MPKRYYKPKDVARLRAELAKLTRRSQALFLKYVYFDYKTAKGREYGTHGFARRICTVQRSISNLYNLIPPTAQKIPPRERLYDAQIQIQACIANVYGCIDNLAWVWVYEKGLENRIHFKRVGFRSNNLDLRKSLSAEFRAYLESRKGWLDYLIDFRDALAHRIPLYVPPGGFLPNTADEYERLEKQINLVITKGDYARYDGLREQQSRLLVFRPVMAHSITEVNRMVPFHVQLLADFATVEEFGNKMMAELERK